MLPSSSEILERYNISRELLVCSGRKFPHRYLLSKILNFKFSVWRWVSEFAGRLVIRYRPFFVAVSLMWNCKICFYQEIFPEYLLGFSKIVELKIYLGFNFWKVLNWPELILWKGHLTTTAKTVAGFRWKYFYKKFAENVSLTFPKRFFNFYDSNGHNVMSDFSVNGFLAKMVFGQWIPSNSDDELFYINPIGKIKAKYFSISVNITGRKTTDVKIIWQMFTLAIYWCSYLSL